MTREPTEDALEAVGNAEQDLGWKCGLESDHQQSQLKPQDSSYWQRGFQISKALKSQMMEMWKARLRILCMTS